MKSEVELGYEDKLSKLENHFNALLAKERIAKGKADLKNTVLEGEMEELKTKAIDQENVRGSSRSTTDKELSKKLKKLNRTMPIK